MSRHAVAFLLAVGISLALFFLMQTLITLAPPGQAASPPSAHLSPVRRAHEPAREPPRPREKPPLPPTARPMATERRIAAPPPEPLASPAPSLNLPLALSGKPSYGGTLVGAGGRSRLGARALDLGAEAFDGRDVIPIASIRPRYPVYAAERGIEGWVELSFTIAADGRVNSVRILDAYPRGIFEDAAAAAVAEWLYPPFRLNGRPVLREAAQHFDFSREDIDALHLFDD